MLTAADDRTGAVIDMAAECAALASPETVAAFASAYSFGSVMASTLASSAALIVAECVAAVPDSGSRTSVPEVNPSASPVEATYTLPGLVAGAETDSLNVADRARVAGTSEAEAILGESTTSCPAVSAALAVLEESTTTEDAKYTCGLAMALTFVRPAEESVNVTAEPDAETELALAATRTSLDELCVAELPSRMSMLPVLFVTDSLKVSVTAPVARSIVALFSTGGLVTVIALAILTLSALPPSVTAPALRCRCGVDMPCTLVTCWAVSVAVPAVPDTASVPVTSVPELYAPVALSRM